MPLQILAFGAHRLFEALGYADVPTEHQDKICAQTCSMAFQQRKLSSPQRLWDVRAKSEEEGVAAVVIPPLRWLCNEVTLFARRGEVRQETILVQ